jgi:hypothetical protein
LGAVLGAGKAAAGIFVALSALSFVRSHNLFASLRLPALSGLQKMLDAQKDPDAAQA